MPEVGGESLREFAARLAQGPAFLLLGAESTVGVDSPTVLYRWNGVYTTRVDKAVTSAFGADWRTTVPVGAMSAAPSRSQTELQVRYLYGGQHLPEGERPPADPLEEADARVRCLQELSRLVTETVTPRGVIVVDGWFPDDRLASTDLVPALRSLGPAQVHLFSSSHWNDDPFVISLAKAGQLVLHEERLDTALAALTDAGLVAGESSSADRTDQRVIALGDGFEGIDIHLWNQIRRSARPIDLSLLTAPVFSSDAARYQEFRSFAGATEGTPRWRGIAAGMNIRRDFEAALLAEVTQALEAQELRPPIVVRGQTATGKSVALAALAADLARTGDVAVLHQSRRAIRPSPEDVDTFAAWAEERKAKATVLVWDGMTDPDEYGTIWRQLRSRGRKLLIVGTAYLGRDISAPFVEAPTELTRKESEQLRSLLGSFGVDVPATNKALDSSFLAFLYHSLPESHSVLRSGLSNEMRAAERGMEKLVRERGTAPTQTDRLTAMAAALRAAGFDLAEALTSSDSDDEGVPLKDRSFAQRSAIQRVTTLVLVAGRHGVQVPIDLALRVLGREGSQSIRDALNAFDIIREVDDDSGEYFLSVRSRLEAELLAQHEITLDIEIEVITEAIRNVRVQQGYGGASDEVQFVVALLEGISTKAHPARYRAYYGQVADALEDRREETGIANPRLVLQESNFARDYVHWRQERGVDRPADRIARLEHNRELLDDVLADSTLSQMMRLALTVELAATSGAILHEVATAPDGQVTAGMLAGRLDDILEAVLRARTIDPANVYPVDVLAWSTRDAIKTGLLAPNERFSRLADAVATIDSIDRDMLMPGQSAQLSSRSAELNKLLHDDEAFWANVRDLEANSDPAATYFLAKLESSDGAEGVARAIARLANSPSAYTDWRCAQLFLELTWQSLTGQRLLAGERVPIHLNSDDLGKLARLTSELDGAALPNRYKLLFVRGLTQFMGNEYEAAQRSFREVEGLTRQLSRRLYTAMVLAEASGTPKLFTGRVEWVRDRRGEVWVNELGTRVAFEPHLFAASRDLARHEQLPAFIIGFKLTRGPVAEPRNMFRASRHA